MRNLAFMISGVALLIAIFLTFVFKIEVDLNSSYPKRHSLDINGSFEYINYDFPSKWETSLPEEKPAFQIILDTLNVKEGRQSLKLKILDYDLMDGQRNWGISQTIPIIAGKSYQLGFWIKNQDTDFVVTIGQPGDETIRDTIIRSDRSFDSWTYVDFKYRANSKTNKIRIDLNLFSEGCFWIDDIRIEEIQ